MNKTAVSILEVGPRDGFQNLHEILPTGEKLEIIDGLIASGVRDIEITSFVSPKAIPQMADAKAVAMACVEKYPDTTLWALIPNLHGAKAAVECGIHNVNYVISLSETHNRANINRTHEQSFTELESILETYPQLHICVGMATAFGCPFEGRPSIDAAVAFARRLWALGIREINLADTIGVADPAQVRDTIYAMKRELPDCRFHVHIHDTRNMGMVNSLMAIEAGIHVVETSLGGLGGCPFAPGASGNTATEDLVYMLARMGYETGIGFDRLLALAKDVYRMIPGIYSGHHIHIKTDSACCRP